MSYYVFAADNAGDLIYELITCEHCTYFRKAEDLGYRYRYSCDNPAGMVRPEPAGFCSCAAWRPREDADHE